jgi:L-rhamnose mutarotase
MVEALRDAGISIYSNFQYGLTLFSYFETDDIEKIRQYLANSETNQRWSEWMDPIMKVEFDPTAQFPYLLPCNGTWVDPISIRLKGTAFWLQTLMGGSWAMVGFIEPLHLRGLSMNRL